MTNFTLHPRLAADTIFVKDLALCRVLAMNDARYSWAVLVPRRAGATEIFDLSATDRALLIGEAARAAEGLKRIARADKINVAALGNLVPQLHVHVVARRIGDAAWPGPVWGQGSAVPYRPDVLDGLIMALAAAL